MTMAELAEEYDWSLRLLTTRLKELKRDPEANRRRIEDLKSLISDTRQIRNVCRDYYKKEAWLNADYTVRYTLQRTPRRSAGVDATKRRNKRGIDPETVKEPDRGYSNRVDPATAAGLAALFVRGAAEQRHRTAAWGLLEHRDQNPAAGTAATL